MRKYFTVLLIVAISTALVGCSKRTLFDKLISLERGSSHLIVNKQTLGFGEVVYLTNEKHKNRGTIVMLHGFGANKDTWARFARNLGEEYRLIIPDLPGHGESTQDLSLNYDIEEQAKRLNEFLLAVNAEKIHLVANSMGGAIALRFAYRFPQSVKSLTLIDSLGAIKTPSAMDELVKTSGKNPMTDIKNVSDYKAMMNFAMVDPPYIPGFLVDVLAEEKIKRSAIEQKILRDIRIDADQTAILPEIHVPTLIIWGAQDKVLHVDDAEYFHEKIRGSRKVLIQGTGHVPMVEKPKETALLFVSFLKEVLAKESDQARTGATTILPAVAGAP